MIIFIMKNGIVKNQNEILSEEKKKKKRSLRELNQNNY